MSKKMKNKMNKILNWKIACKNKKLKKHRRDERGRFSTEEITFTVFVTKRINAAEQKREKRRGSRNVGTFERICPEGKDKSSTQKKKIGSG